MERPPSGPDGGMRSQTPQNAPVFRCFFRFSFCLQKNLLWPPVICSLYERQWNKTLSIVGGALLCRTNRSWVCAQRFVAGGQFVQAQLPGTAAADSWGVDFPREAAYRWKRRCRAGWFPGNVQSAHRPCAGRGAADGAADYTTAADSAAGLPYMRRRVGI